MDTCQSPFESAIGSLLPFFNGVDASELDGQIQNFLRLLGRVIFERSLDRLCGYELARAREDGWHVHRSPEIEVQSLFGVHRIRSPYLRHKHNAGGARPLQSELGLTHGARTPALQRALSDFGGEMSFERASKSFAEHYGWQPERSAVRRVTIQVAQQAQSFVDEQLSSKEPALTPASDMLLELDGSMVRTGQLVPRAPPGKTPVRRLEAKARVTEWREVRLGVVRPLGEQTPTYVAKLAAHAEMAEQMHRAALLRGLSEATKVHAVGDGGNGLREALMKRFPGMSFTLDWAHLVSHVHETAEAMSRPKEQREKWVDKQLERIMAGRHQRVRQELSEYQGRGQKRVRRLLGYLTVHANALDYGSKRAKGLPIGSGEVESGHRSVIQSRMKLPGAWWRVEHLNPMLALRVVRSNDWWQRFWSGGAHRWPSRHQPTKHAVLPTVA
jgi:hypothetical protein